MQACYRGARLAVPSHKHDLCAKFLNSYRWNVAPFSQTQSLQANIYHSYWFAAIGSKMLWAAKQMSDEYACDFQKGQECVMSVEISEAPLYLILVLSTVLHHVLHGTGL